MKRIAIVGSREFPSQQAVIDFVRSLPRGVVVVSGGAKGVDTWAAVEAKRSGIETKEHFPMTDNCITRADYTKAFYARNQVVVNDCDELVAFTEKVTGGTWDAIHRAVIAKKKVTINP